MFKIILVLLGAIQAIAFIWINAVNSKADRVPVLEERLTNVQNTVDEIKQGVNRLLQKRER